MEELNNQKEYFYIYKTTCLCGSFKGKFYIGRHKTKDLNDEYAGSGKLISLYFKKHGKIINETYTKEILEFNNSQEENINREDEIIQTQFFVSDMCLNLARGKSFLCGEYNSQFGKHEHFKRPFICLTDDMIFIKEYKKTAELLNDFPKGINIHKVLGKYTKHAAGYRWIYKTEYIDKINEYLKIENINNIILENDINFNCISGELYSLLFSEKFKNFLKQDPNIYMVKKDLSGENNGMHHSRHVVTKETRLKQSIAHKGKSPSTLGTHLSQEQKDHLSKLIKGKPNIKNRGNLNGMHNKYPKNIIHVARCDIQTHKIIDIFMSISDAKKYFPKCKNILKVLRGERPHCGGFFWKKLSDNEFEDLKNKGINYYDKRMDCDA